MGRPQSTSKSPLGTVSSNIDKKKQVITESVERLSSAKKLPAGQQKEDDLIFSIKMSKDEYNQYQKVREDVKKERPSTSTKKKATLTTTKGRNITPNKRR